MTIHLPEGYEDPNKKNAPSKLEITGMWATLACTALSVILLVYKMLQ
jgi:hypothetical protein